MTLGWLAILPSQQGIDDLVTSLIKSLHFHFPSKVLWLSLGPVWGKDDLARVGFLSSAAAAVVVVHRRRSQRAQASPMHFSDMFTFIVKNVKRPLISLLSYCERTS